MVHNVMYETLKHLTTNKQNKMTITILLITYAGLAYLKTRIRNESNIK